MGWMSEIVDGSRQKVVGIYLRTCQKQAVHLKICPAPAGLRPPLLDRTGRTLQGVLM